MQRRGFLKAFLGAAVGAGLVAAVPKPFLPTPIPTDLQRITFTQLAERFGIGENHPDILICSRSMYERLKQLGYVPYDEEEQIVEPWMTYGMAIRSDLLEEAKANV